MSSIKLCVVGPCEAGKTLMCKLLAQTPADRQYVPTQGLRVQEVERRVGLSHVNVQLWDCSGDFKYQTCFPAMSLGMDGLIVVYDPDEDGREPELEKWFQVFSQQGDIQLSANQCLILGVHRGQIGRPRAPIQGKLTKLPNAIVSVGGDPQNDAAAVGNEIDRLLSHVVALKREMEENSVMN